MPRIVITEPDGQGQPYRFEIDHKRVSIGRGSDNDILLTHRSTSSEHCTMERVKGGFILRDQDSTNGIQQDKSLMQVIDLKDGMQLRMGDVTLDFELTEEEIETLSKEGFVPHQMKKQAASQPEAEVSNNIPALKENSVSSGASKRSEESSSPSSPSPTPPSPPSYNQPVIRSGGSSAKPLLVFILIIAAIFTGMTISHKLRTGDSLPSKLIDLLKRKPVSEKAAQPMDPSAPLKAEE
jgi:pSer/pThr/pTyr-binding forkhead associated (FHA) protein